MREIIFGLFLLVAIGAVEAQGAYDHQYSHWQSVLNAYAYEGRVNYIGLKENDSAFKTLIQIIEGVSKSEFEAFNIKQKMAFWINAYNIGAVSYTHLTLPTKRIV